jgi:vacuolar-type H+-ATPase subunit C/Vma6
MEDLRYIYPVARARVLETQLLKKGLFLNMLAADNLDAALRMISETAGYASDVLEIKNSDDAAKFINAEMQKLEKLARELFIEPSLFEAYIYLKKDLSKSYALILQTKSDFLEDFIKRFIDLFNIKTFLRINYQRQSLETLKINLIDGGYIPKTKFIDQFGKGWNGIYRETIKDGVEQIEKNGDFSILERGIEDYLVNLLRPAKYMFFGPEAIFAYCLAKENELRLLNLVLSAKINNISQPQIQQRLISSYVQ